MDYYGLLFLYYLKGLSGKSVLKLFFNIEAGGTEQLLPENTSTPTTTPILADIQYPDGLRTDQYFTYREAPTTVSNKARIKTIKGNTLVWNQLVQNGNFADTSNWFAYSASFTVSDNIATITASEQWGRIRNTPIKLINAHKYLVISTVKGTTDNYVEADVGFKYLTTNNEWEIVSFIMEPTSTYNKSISIGDRRSSGWTPFYVKNTMCFDLTLMFGIGNEPSSVDEFTSLFPLSYYAYNAGTLLSFNGTGIKTVGKNLCNVSELMAINTYNGITSSITSDVFKLNGVTSASGGYYFGDNTKSKKFRAGTYTASIICSGAWGTGSVKEVRLRKKSDQSKILSLYDGSANSGTFTLAEDTEIFVVVNSGSNVGANVSVDVSIKVQIEIGSSASSYEPYTSSTLSLPISTYFPNGMKQAGTVYDELIPTKAITRIGAVDLGTLTLNQSTNFYYRQNSQDLGIKADDVVAFNAVDSNITSVYYYSNSGQFRVYVNDISIVPSGMLYYELATPIETSITTEDANEALSLLMGKSVSSSNANQLINIITKGE